MDISVIAVAAGLGPYLIYVAGAAFIIAHAIAAGWIPAPKAGGSKVYAVLFGLLNTVAAANYGAATNAVNKAATDLGIPPAVLKSLVVLTLFGVAGAAVAACTAAQQTAVATLLEVAASKNTTVASLVTKGALFCQRTQPTFDTLAPMVFVAANVAGVPVIVTDQAKAAVDDTCAVFDAVAISPPADTSNVPVVPVPTTTLPPAV